MNTYAIQAEHLSKKYRIGNQEAGQRYVALRDVIASRTTTEEQWSELLRILGEHRSIDYAYRRAVEYAERAKKPLPFGLATFDLRGPIDDFSVIPS